MTEPVSIVRAIVDIVERLAGKVAPLALLASGFFFLAPHWWLGLIGIDSANPAFRLVAGILLVLSAAACVVKFGVALKPALLRAAVALRSHWAYRDVPLQARVLLGLTAHYEASVFFMPADSIAVQALLDRGLLDAEPEERDFRLCRSFKGVKFVNQNRASLRAEAQTHAAIAKTLANQIEVANRRAEERNRHGWMRF